MLLFQKLLKEGLFSGAVSLIFRPRRSRRVRSTQRAARLRLLPVLLAASLTGVEARAQGVAPDPCSDPGYAYCNCGSKPHPRFYPISNEWLGTYDPRQDRVQEHFDAGRMEEALKLAEDLTSYYDPCTEARRVSPDAVANYAVVLHAAGDLGGARAQFERALELFEEERTLDRERQTCALRSGLLLSSFAQFEKTAGDDAAAARYDAWAARCREGARMGAPPPPAEGRPATCGCRVPGDARSRSCRPWLAALVALGLLAARRRSRPCSS